MRQSCLRAAKIRKGRSCLSTYRRVIASSGHEGVRLNVFLAPLALLGMALLIVSNQRIPQDGTTAETSQAACTRIA
jgi:hypothetical protein